MMIYFTFIYLHYLKYYSDYFIVKLFFWKIMSYFFTPEPICIYNAFFLECHLCFPSNIRKYALVFLS